MARFLVALLVLLQVTNIFAKYSFDFTGAAPLTYDHNSGGGAFNTREIGNDKDVVESLEGGDFACGNFVTFLTRLSSTSSSADDQTIELNYEFFAHTSGQQGTAYVDIVNVEINRGVVENGKGEGGTDAGNVEDGNSAVSSSSSLVGELYVKPSIIQLSVLVDDVDAGESIVIRIDALLGCNGETPSGNVQAYLSSANVVLEDDVKIRVSAGAQTVPLTVKDLTPVSTTAVQTTAIQLA